MTRYYYLLIVLRLPCNIYIYFIDWPIRLKEKFLVLKEQISKFVYTVHAISNYLFATFKTIIVLFD